jgi:hypothetical protein
MHCTLDVTANQHASTVAYTLLSAFPLSLSLYVCVLQRVVDGIYCVALRFPAICTLASTLVVVIVVCSIDDILLLVIYT